ncbi:hypothetical protein P4534_04190 [Peribacillus butanolivorans]|uniref:hypothetical protein n=1 Tax=Peribacillus butanolivorans TaxID=421767 RepID=UPI002E1C0BC3|nr:hypothetical protein [Peribacillus butanolivorans]
MVGKLVGMIGWPPFHRVKDCTCLGGMNVFFGDMIYLLFALLMPLLFAIVVFIFIRSTKKQKDSLTKIEGNHKESSEK